MFARSPCWCVPSAIFPRAITVVVPVVAWVQGFFAKLAVDAPDTTANPTLCCPRPLATPQATSCHLSWSHGLHPCRRSFGRACPEVFIRPGGHAPPAPKQKQGIVKCAVSMQARMLAARPGQDSKPSVVFGLCATMPRSLFLCLCQSRGHFA